jgi:hypothetical protein
MNYLRPDERASETSVERSKQHNERLKTGAKTALNVGLAATGLGTASKALGPIASRVLPFINEHIPTDLAIKGISKISPEIGKILQRGMQTGLDVKEGLQFIKGQIQGNEKPPEERNILQKYSDTLHEYIQNMIQQGNPPLEAAAKAKRFLTGKAAEDIKKIEKDYKTDFGNIVESIFGKVNMAQQQPGDSGQLQNDVMNPEGSMPTRPPSAEMQAATNPMSQQGQNPQVKQQLAQAMQLLAQKLKI